MKIEFVSLAKRELSKAALYYEKQVPGLGADFLDEVEVTRNKIRINPLAWTPISKTLRRCRLRRFPYGLIYEILENKILILSVMHLHRKPLEEI
jgi:toxin ParE2